MPTLTLENLMYAVAIGWAVCLLGFIVLAALIAAVRHDVQVHVHAYELDQYDDDPTRTEQDFFDYSDEEWKQIQYEDQRRQDLSFDQHTGQAIKVGNDHGPQLRVSPPEGPPFS